MFECRLDSSRLEEGRAGAEGAELPIYRSQPPKLGYRDRDVSVKLHLIDTRGAVLVG